MFSPCISGFYLGMLASSHCPPCEPVPAVTGQEAGYDTNNYPCFLGGGKKPEYPQRTHHTQGEHVHSTQKGPSLDSSGSDSVHISHREHFKSRNYCASRNGSSTSGFHAMRLEHACQDLICVDA